jgi:hypothetical protein
VTRWTRRLLVGAIAILVPALAGCEAGLDAPTLQYHPASNGVSTTVNGIELDNVFVLGPQLNQTLPAGGQAGVFLAVSSLNHDRLVSAAAPGAASSVQLLNGPVTIIPGATVYLTGPAPLIVLNGLTNPLSGGETIRLVLTFASAGVVPLVVPVLPAAYDYTTFSPPPAPSASTAAIVKHKHKAKTGPSPAAAP